MGGTARARRPVVDVRCENRTAGDGHIHRGGVIRPDKTGGDNRAVIDCYRTVCNVSALGQVGVARAYIAAGDDHAVFYRDDSGNAAIYFSSSAADGRRLSGAVVAGGRDDHAAGDREREVGVGAIKTAADARAV